MGRPGMAEKQQNLMTHRGGNRLVRRRLAVKIFRQGLLAVLLLPGRRVYQGGGQKSLPRPKPVWPENESKRPSSGSIGFGKFF